MSRTLFRLALVCAALLGLGGCEEDPPPPLPVVKVTAGPAWLALAPTLIGPHEREDENPCRVGTPECISAVVAEMQSRLDQLAAACDHRAPFALMYLRVTEGVQQGGAAEFDDPSYLNHLDAVFARLYFDAFEAHQEGRKEDVPTAWRLAFDTAEARQVSGVGDMLLGMNAHISRDLPFALVQAGMTTASGADGRADFDRVNGLLSRVSRTMIEEEAERFDRSISSFTLPVLDAGPRDIGTLLAGWRTEAYANAQRLLAASTPGEQAVVAAEIEEGAAQRGRLIATVTSYALSGERTLARDEQCLRRRR